jgi:hypothetical protein
MCSPNRYCALSAVFVKQARQISADDLDVPAHHHRREVHHLLTAPVEQHEFRRVRAALVNCYP